MEKGGLFLKKRICSVGANSKDNQSAEGAGGLGIIRGNKVGETE